MTEQEEEKEELLARLLKIGSGLQLLDEKEGWMPLRLASDSVKIGGVWVSHQQLLELAYLAQRWEALANCDCKDCL